MKRPLTIVRMSLRLSLVHLERRTISGTQSRSCTRSGGPHESRGLPNILIELPDTRQP
jgi:hypothetical protein